MLSFVLRLTELCAQDDLREVRRLELNMCCHPERTDMSYVHSTPRRSAPVIPLLDWVCRCSTVTRISPENQPRGADGHSPGSHHHTPSLTKYRVRQVRVVAEKRNDPRDKPKDRFCLIVFPVSDRPLANAELRCHIGLGEAYQAEAAAR